MSYLLGQMFVYLLVAALIGGIIGWFLRGGCGEKVSEKQTKSDLKKDTGVKPVFLSKARSEGKDNLTLIKGVGPVLEERLNKLGVYHFDQIASWTNEQQKWVDEKMAFPGRIGREDWVQQAKTLSLGIDTEFSQRVKKGEVSSSSQT